MKFVKEFKAFISRGNVMDLAVAVIVGAAFNAIITSFVGDLFTPLLSLLTGGIDFSHLSVKIGPGETGAILAYGKFIQTLINFLIVSTAVFLLIKVINFVLQKKKEEDPPTKTCPYCATDIPEVALRCPNCTSILDEQAFAQSAATPQEPDTA